MNKTTIKSRDHKTIVANFKVLADPNPGPARDPGMAIMVEPVRGEKFLLPMDMPAARELGWMLLRTVFAVSPGVFFEPYLDDSAGPAAKGLRKKLAKDGLTYEDFLQAFGG